MSDFRPALWLAIHNRLSGDATLTGYVGTRIFNVWEKATEGDAYPSACMTDVDGRRTDGFNAKIFEYQFDWHVFVRYRVTGQDGLAVGSAICERIEGPWPTTVTYGLDRWTPDITATGYTADNIRQLAEPRSEHSDDVYHWVLPFSSLVSRSGS